MKTKYEVFNITTGAKVAGPYSTSKRAYDKSNKLDLEYGAINYGIRLTGDTMRTFHMMGLKVTITFPPRRTVSDVPSDSIMAVFDGQNVRTINLDRLPADLSRHLPTGTAHAMPDLFRPFITLAIARGLL